MGEKKPSKNSASIILLTLGFAGGLFYVTYATCGTLGRHFVGIGSDAVNEKAKKLPTPTPGAIPDTLSAKLKKKIKSPAVIHDKIAQCASTKTVKWSVIAANLQDNEARVVSIWKGSCAKVSGIIYRIHSDFTDSPVVTISSGKNFRYTRLHCHPQNEERALQLSKGQKITVWGVGGEEAMGNLSLEHCDW